MGFVTPIRIAGSSSGWAREAITIPLPSGWPTTADCARGPAQQHLCHRLGWTAGDRQTTQHGYGETPGATLTVAAHAQDLRARSPATRRATVSAAARFDVQIRFLGVSLSLVGSALCSSASAATVSGLAQGGRAASTHRCMLCCAASDIRRFCRFCPTCPTTVPQGETVSLRPWHSRMLAMLHRSIYFCNPHY